MSKTIRLRTELLHKPLKSEHVYCHHPQVVVDSEFRLLHCEKCGLWIEPFDYLQGWAVKDWAAERHAKHWEETRDCLAKEVTALKKEERRIKARLRRAKKKD